MRAFLLVFSLAVAGCCQCPDRVDEHSRRPGDVVRELREAVGDRKWDRAALCFSEEVRARNGAEMRSGVFPIGPADTLVGIDMENGRAIARMDPPRQFVLEKDASGQWVITAWR